MANVRTPHVDSRQPQVLDEAARLFSSRGFEGTSVRDIARAVGMLPGSIYCHFATKEELLLAVYVKGVEQISAAVRNAVSGHSDPWQRLEAACIAHLESVLRDDNYARVVISVRPSDALSARKDLIALRDRYEAVFVDLVKALPLARRVDRKVLRLMLLGALNWSQLWYQPQGTLRPRAIARQFVALLRQGLEDLP